MKTLYAHHATTIGLVADDPTSETACLAIGDVSEAAFKEHGCPGSFFAFVPQDDRARVMQALGLSPEALAATFAQAPAYFGEFAQAFRLKAPTVSAKPPT